MCWFVQLYCFVRRGFAVLLSKKTYMEVMYRR